MQRNVWLAVGKDCMCCAQAIYAMAGGLLQELEGLFLRMPFPRCSPSAVRATSRSTHAPLRCSSKRKPGRARTTSRRGGQKTPPPTTKTRSSSRLAQWTRLAAAAVRRDRGTAEGATQYSSKSGEVQASAACVAETTWWTLTGDGLACRRACSAWYSVMRLQRVSARTVLGKT